MFRKRRKGKKKIKKKKEEKKKGKFQTVPVICLAVTNSGL